jgi:hypothetical protein
MSKDSLANCSALTTSNLCYKHIQCMLQWAKGEETANSSAPIFVTSLVDGSVISQYQGLINSTLTSQCRDHGLPLYCRYLYSPCTEESEEFALTRQECVSLKSDICKAEFTFLSHLSKQQAKLSSLIPNCNTFKAGDGNHTGNSSARYLTRTNVTCHPDYVRTCDLCLLSCKSTVDIYKVPGLKFAVHDICMCLFLCLMIITSLVFIVFSIVKRKVMLKFPTILVFYSNAVQLFGGIIVYVYSCGLVNVCM